MEKGEQNKGRQHEAIRKDQQSWRDRISIVVDHPWFMRFIIGLILINAVIVGLETYRGLYENFGAWFYYADRVLLWLFTVEIILRLIASKPLSGYFKDSWNLFDLFIVLSGHLFVGAHFVTVLRILRVLRLLRAISVIPSLKKIVNALLLTIPALGNIMLLLSLVFYIFAVIGTSLFGKYMPEYFGTLHHTLITLFQVVTLESWASAVMRPVLEFAPWAWIYFVSFILIGTFVIVNLFVGVIVSNVEKANEELLEGEAAEQATTAAAMFDSEPHQIVSEAKPNGLEQEIKSLRQEIQELKTLIKQDRQDKNI